MPASPAAFKPTLFFKLLKLDDYHIRYAPRISEGGIWVDRQHAKEGPASDRPEIVEFLLWRFDGGQSSPGSHHQPAPPPAAEDLGRVFQGIASHFKHLHEHTNIQTFLRV
jgi:hypothetical protein